MSITYSFSVAEAKLAELCDLVTGNREAMVIRREDAEDVALIAAAELSSLLETVHLLKSPRNAERLYAALERALLEEAEE